MQKIFVKTAVRGYSVLRAFGVCTHTLQRVRYHPAPNKKMQKKITAKILFFAVFGDCSGTALFSLGKQI